MNCGNTNGMKMWSSQLYHNLNNCKISPKKKIFGASCLTCGQAFLFIPLSSEKKTSGALVSFVHIAEPQRSRSVFTTFTFVFIFRKEN